MFFINNDIIYKCFNCSNCMPEQRWYCETCNRTGAVNYEEHADLMEVIYKVDDDHRSMSSKCPTGYRGIRVINDSFRPGVEEKVA